MSTETGFEIFCSFTGTVDLASTWTTWTDTTKEASTVTAVSGVSTITPHSDGNTHTTTLGDAIFNSYEVTYFACTYTNTDWDFDMTMKTTMTKSVFLKELPASTYVTDGTYDLECQFGTSNLPIKDEWTSANGQKTTSQVKTSMLSTYTVSATKAVKIKDQVDSTEEDYTCSFTDSKDNVYTSMTSLVYVSLTISSDVGDKGVVEVTSSSNVLTCLITADLGVVKEEYVKWYNSAGEVVSEEDGDYTIATSAATRQSTIAINILVDDTFTCAFVKDDFKVEDSVRAYSSELSISDSTETYLNSGEAFSLTCSFVTADDGLVINWHVNDFSVTSYKDFHTVEQSDVAGGVESVLTVHDFLTDLAKIPKTLTYKCDIKTSFGTLNSETKTLNLRLSAPLATSYVFLQDSWEISCVMIAGIAPSSITWYKGETVVLEQSLNSNKVVQAVEGAAFVASTKGDVNVLSASKTTIDDSGSYTCTFAFSAGPSTSASMDVSIRLVEMEESQVYSLGDSHEMTCLVYAKTDHSKVMWYHDDKLITSKFYILIFLLFPLKLPLL